MAEYLMSSLHSLKDKEQTLKAYLARLFLRLGQKQERTETLIAANPLYQVAHYLSEHCEDDRAIESISADFGYSAGYLVRAFKRHFNMTPHAYRLNRRVQLGQQALKQGEAISAVAQNTGFSDSSSLPAGVQTTGCSDTESVSPLCVKAVLKYKQHTAGREQKCQAFIQ